MPELSEEQKQRIISALEERGAKFPCPRCGNISFVLLDGYQNNPLTSKIGAIVLGGANVPAVIVACARCGWLAQHALGPLGLLPAQEEAKEEANVEQSS